MRKGDRKSDTGIIHRTMEIMTRKSFGLFFGKVQRIVHVHLYDRYSRCFPIFFRPCGRPSPISGQIESGELPEVACIREIKEEIGIVIDRVYSASHSFWGISPKGKRIHGITCFALLPEKIDPEAFTFNNEISGFLWATPSDAMSILRKKGFPEAVSGFKCLLARQLIERVTTA